MITVKKRSQRKLTTISMEYRDTVKDENATEYASLIGKLPYVVINGITIESTDIKMFKLYNDEFFPSLEMIFSDPTNKIHDSGYPLDKQIVSIMIKADSELLMPIRMDFFINSFTSIKKNAGDNEEKQYSLEAVLDVKYIVKNYSMKGTSYTVLQKIAETLDLGFASNIDDTVDEMVWLNPGIDYIREYVPHIVKHSYMNDETFLWAYIDFYYNLNYIDVEKQMKESTKNASSVIGTEKLTGDQGTIPLILSNHPDKSSTNLHIDKYNLINDSTKVNYRLGYNPTIIYYDRKLKNLSSVKIDPISTKGTKSDLIVMKGQPNDNNYLEDQEKNYFVGQIDTDNVHKNYLYADKLNAHNLDFLQKIRMNIVMDNVNYQLYRFQTVKIEIYKLREMDSTMTFMDPKDAEDKKKNKDTYKLNNRLSGDWLIIGINYSFKGKGSKFIQEVTVVKRELGTSDDEK